MDIDKIKKAIIKKPYLFSVVFFGYIAVNVFANKIYPSVLLSLKTSFVILFLVFNLSVAVLIATNINLIVLKYKEIKQKEKNLTALGTMVGLFGGACPGCFVGVFPAVLGIFGITASISILPLYGIELQILSAIFLLTSIHFLTKPSTCKMK